MNNQLSGIPQWIINLEIRVSKLRFNCKVSKLEDAEKQLDKCKAFLSRIYDVASLQSHSLHIYRDQIHSIQDELLEIHEAIENRKLTSWARFGKSIKSILRVVSSILGLPSFMFPSLGEGDRKLLE